MSESPGDRRARGEHDIKLDDRDSLETTTGLRFAGAKRALRKMSSSEPKWKNAKRYVNIAMS